MTNARRVLLAIALPIVGLVIYFGFFAGGVESSLRLYVDATVNGFMRAQKDLDQELKINPSSGLPDRMAARWQKTPGKIFGVSEVIFGTNGQIAIFSDQFDVVVYLKPSGGAPTKWECTTFPHQRFVSLCSMLNAKRDDVKRE